ncbi:MAG: hypothetical protein HZA91_11045 [Verrucomicrobia bacterium]|nr:hypothetical protein [Verrucomicrobiota bacterium]
MKQTRGSPKLPTARKSGQMVVAAACLMLAMIAVLGLVTDVGLLECSRLHAQRAADAAAQAGARELLMATGGIYDENAVSAAQTYALKNAILSSNVTVELPPTTSAHFNSSNRYVRVHVKLPTRTTFMRLFLRLPVVNVAAAATAGAVPSPIPVTILTSSPHAPAALKVSGGGTLRIVGGSVYVNSDDAQAASIDGSSTVEATEFDVVGGVDHPDQIQGTVLTGMLAESDPFAQRVAPEFVDASAVRYPDGTMGYISPTSGGTASKPASKSVSSDTTLYPGIYYGGIKITGGNVTLMPGRYIMAGGGFSVSGSGTGISGTDVFFYNTQDPYRTTAAGAFADISLTGGANLFAPTAAIDSYYKGFLFFNDRNPDNTSTIKLAGQMAVGDSAPLKGYIYSANGDVQITGGAGSAGLGVVAKTVTITGGGTLGAIDKTRIPNMNIVRLVE